MTINIVKIPIAPKPKPRGQLGKYGNMTHSLKGYREWQDELDKYLRIAKFIIPDNFYGIIYHFGIVKKRGGKPDISNLVGGIEDVLVKYDYINDDNYQVIKHYFASAIQSEKSFINIYVTDNKAEFLYVLNKLI